MGWLLAFIFALYSIVEGGAQIGDCEPGTSGDLCWAGGRGRQHSMLQKGSSNEGIVEGVFREADEKPKVPDDGDEDWMSIGTAMRTTSTGENPEEYTALASQAEKKGGATKQNQGKSSMNVKHARGTSPIAQNSRNLGNRKHNLDLHGDKQADKREKHTKDEKDATQETETSGDCNKDMKDAEASSKAKKNKMKVNSDDEGKESLAKSSKQSKAHKTAHGNAMIQMKANRNGGEQQERSWKVERQRHHPTSVVACSTCAQFEGGKDQCCWVLCGNGTGEYCWGPKANGQCPSGMTACA